MLLLASGVLGIGLSIVVTIAVLAAWLSGTIAVRGYTPLMLAIMFSTPLILLGLGITGNYAWRAFENTKRRPTAIPLIHESFKKAPVHMEESDDGNRSRLGEK